MRAGHRCLSVQVDADLKRKMVFLAGPRHVGKTMLARALLSNGADHEDTAGRDLELRYFRDTDGLEVDFVVAEKGRPILLVEAKWSAGPIDPSLRYLKLRYPGADAWQVHATGTKDFVGPDGVRVAPAWTFLATLI